MSYSDHFLAGSSADSIEQEDQFGYLRGRNNGCLNIVVVGRTGEGKSATLNSIISHGDAPKPSFFKEAQSAYSVTKEKSQCNVNFFGLNCRLVDTMGMFDTETTQERKAELQFMSIPNLEDDHKVVLSNLADVVSYCSNGIDAFLLVVSGIDRLTVETKETINIIQRFFGVAMLDHCIFVLTKADLAQSGTMEQTQDVITKYLCKIGYDGIDGRFVYFNNASRPKAQVIKLMKMIQGNIEKLNGHPYNHIAFQEAQKLMAREKEELKRKMETEKQNYIDSATEKIRGEHNKQMTKLQSQMNEKERLINNLSAEQVEERKKYNEEIKGLQNQMTHLENSKERDINRAVEEATRKSNNAYQVQFREMENRFQQQNVLLKQSNDAVLALTEQVKELQNRPPVVEHHYHERVIERGGGGCFAGECAVDTPEGRKPMRDLKVGDFVLSMKDNGEFEYVPMLLWMQADYNDSMEFLEIHTKYGMDSSVTVDVDADTLVPGDFVCNFVDHSSFPDEVLKVIPIQKLGIFSPLTSSGRIVVDGILCSCYARITTGYVNYSHATAHLICSPMRWLLSVNKYSPTFAYVSKSYLYGWIWLNRFLTQVSTLKKEKYLKY